MAARKISPSDSVYTSSASANSITSPQAGNWTASQVYTSPEFQIREEYRRLTQQHTKARLSNSNSSFFHNSPFFPGTFQDYLQHREGRLRDSKEELEAAIRARKDASRARRKNPACTEAMPVYGGRREWNEVVLPLDRYVNLSNNWFPVNDGVVMANQGFDRSKSFEMQGRRFVGNRLMQKL